MSENLKISCVQADLAWESIDENLEKFSKFLYKIPLETELVILPEMFTTGFSMNSAELAESMDGKTINWMKKESKKHNKIILGSTIIKENEKFYNRCITMFPNGKFFTYDKGHLFRMEKEHEDFTKGNQKTIFEHNAWRVCTMICYDLRFPVWSRNQGEYDLLIYIASWPESRREVWNTLLKARAIENQVYVVGVNRIGKDGEGISYSGDSVIINPKGQVIEKARDYSEEVISAELSLNELKSFRDKFPVYLDADKFKLL